MLRANKCNYSKYFATYFVQMLYAILQQFADRIHFAEKTKNASRIFNEMLIAQVLQLDLKQKCSSEDEFGSER